MAPAQDDSAYQDNPYGVADPTALFTKFTDQNNARYMQGGGMNQAALNLGMNPAMQKANAVQARMKEILGQVDDHDAQSDPLAYQMRQAAAVQKGMVDIDPNVAMNATAQMVRLQNAKKQQDALTSETALRTQQANKLGAEASQAAAEGYVLVERGIDNINGMQFPASKLYGSPLDVIDPKTGAVTDQGHQDLLKAVNDASKAGHQVVPMPLAAYQAQLAKENEGKAASAGYAALLGYQKTIQAANINATAGLGMMTPETRDRAAIDVLMQPEHMNLYAIGNKSNAIRADLNNRGTELMGVLGIGQSELNAWRAEIKNANKTGGLMQNNLSQLSVAENLLVPNLNRIMSLVQDIDATGIPAIEGYRRTLISKYGYKDGSVELNQKVNEFRGTLTTALPELARIISGNPNMTGVLSDTARDEMRDILGGNMDAPSMINNIKRVIAEVQFKKVGYAGELSRLYQLNRNPDTSTAALTPASPPANAGSGPNPANIETPPPASSQPAPGSPPQAQAKILPEGRVLTQAAAQANMTPEQYTRWLRSIGYKKLGE